MKSILNLTRGRLISITVIVAAILAIIGVFFATANATENAEENADRTIAFSVIDPVGGSITPEYVTIPESETSDTYTIAIEEPTNAEEKIIYLKVTCGSSTSTIKCTIENVEDFSKVALIDSNDTMHLKTDTYTFSKLKSEEEPNVNYFRLAFYGDKLYSGYVHAAETSEAQHNYFLIRAYVLGQWVPVNYICELLGIPWPWGEKPFYIWEYMATDSSILEGREFTIDDEGTINFNIYVAGVQTVLQAKAVGKDGAKFKNWVLNGNVVPKGPGVVPAPLPYPDTTDVFYYDLEAHYYSDNDKVVTFDSQGGSEVDAQIVEKGQKATKPADPSKENCKFDGWFDNALCTGSAFDFANTPINDNITLYAKWIELPHIIEGGDAVWYYGSAQGLTFKSSAKLADFLRVTVNGDEVDSSAYTLGTDETITITLSPDYMNFMSEGTHELGIVSNFVANEEMVAKCNFTVTYEPVPVVPDNPTSGPATGDCVLWIAVLSVIFGCLVFVSSKLRRHNSTK